MICRVCELEKTGGCLCNYCSDCLDVYGHENCQYHTKEWIEEHGDTPDDTRTGEEVQIE
ncbi:hypothetical protein LCGC14_1670980 [marine sediment metagenome]|uniref:Uncharacterized protein n=1 Tax=marine sediment metagenome TaxID=412755 RepID=A0A0F9IDX1_9ZZZZ